MARVYLFSDEAGDFTFKRVAGASNYFLIATVMTTDGREGDALQALQRELAWRGRVLERFHAVDDRPDIRGEVYDLIARSSLRIDATALYKPKAQNHVRANPVYFYKLATYLHFQYVVPRVTTRADDLMVTASSLQIKKKKAALHDAVGAVVHQVSPTRRFLSRQVDPAPDSSAVSIGCGRRREESGDSVLLQVPA